MTKKELMNTINVLDNYIDTLKDTKTEKQRLSGVVSELEVLLEEMIIHKREKAKLVLLPWDED